MEHKDYNTQSNETIDSNTVNPRNFTINGTDPNTRSKWGMKEMTLLIETEGTESTCVKGVWTQSERDGIKTL